MRGNGIGRGFAIVSLSVLLSSVAGAQSYPRVETFGPELDGGTGGVSVDAAGNVYVADFGVVLTDPAQMGRTVFQITPAGEARVFATGLEGASGNDFDAAGNLLQSNIRGNLISLIHPDGTSEPYASEGVSLPVGIVIDDAGVAFVANCGNGTILEVQPDRSTRILVESTLLKCANGITMDGEHNLYVANFNNGDVVKVTPSGDVSVLATVPGGNNGHLIFLDGLLYVVARAAHQVYTVSLDGDVRLLAGSGERGRRDGPALQATFSFPNDLAASPDGRYLYVNEIASDTGDHTRLAPMVVRRIVLRP